MIASSRTDQEGCTIAIPWRSAMTGYGHKALQLLAATAGVAVALMVGAGCAMAQGQPDIFTVNGVPVDSRARATTDARAQGLESGQIEALDRLFKRLVPREYLNRLAALSTRDAIEHVRDFSVSNERTSPGRYLADLSVRFRPDAVRTTLRFSNVPFAETVSKPVVVIPIYQESVVAEPTLWADPNPWRDAWDKLPPPTGLVPRELPYVDLQDVTMLRVEDIQARDRETIRAWAQRYGADNAVAVTASLMGSIGAESVRISVYFTRTGEEKVISVPATGAQTWDDLFYAGAAEAWAEIEDQWKRDNMLRFDVTGQITALVPLTALQDWLTVRDRLEDVPSIDRYELQAITTDRAQVTLYFLGDLDQLSLAMAQSDLAFAQQDGAWMIEDRASGRPAIEVIGGQPGRSAPVPAPPMQNPVPAAIGQDLPPEVYPSGLLDGNRTSDLQR